MPVGRPFSWIAACWRLVAVAASAAVAAAAALAVVARCGPRMLNAKDAARIDEELMGPMYGFSVEQLMELAGLAVAQVCYRQHPPRQKGSRVLICVGPGNNGGDGLVAARHLFHYGYAPVVVYPKQPQKELYQALVKQCRMLDIPVEQDWAAATKDSSWDLIVDSLFGFGFKGPARDPFPALLAYVGQQIDAGTPVLSVDVPSGWDVNGATADSFHPTTLVSLTSPKLCAEHFHGNHWLGGRFVPPRLAAEFDLNLPSYPGDAGVVLLEEPKAQQ